MIQPFDDSYFIKKALDLAQQAYQEDEVPVGAIIVCEGKIIAKGYNQTQRLKDVTAHAEIIAYTSATQFLDSKYMTNAVLYVTLEPCVMCAGMLKWAQFKKIVFGAYDPKGGYSSISSNILHPKTEVIGGILEQECGQILSDFFSEKRKKAE